MIMWLAAMLVLPTCMATILDLTHTYDEKVLYPPVGPHGADGLFNFTIMQRGWDKTLNQWLEFNRFGVFEHGGTHMDAPAHCAEGRKHLHEVPVTQFIGPGVMIDMTKQAETDEDYLMTIDDIKTMETYMSTYGKAHIFMEPDIIQTNWEKEHGEIPQNAIVMMNTGKHKLYPNRKLFYGTDTPDDVTTYHNPGVHPSAATWLVHNRQIKALGTDSHSCDPGQNHNRNLCHLALLPNDVVLLEFVANLDRMPPTGSTIFLGPIKMRDGSGGPVRILSIYGEHSLDNSVTSGVEMAGCYTCLTTMLLAVLARVLV